MHYISSETETIRKLYGCFAHPDIVHDSRYHATNRMWMALDDIPWLQQCVETFQQVLYSV